MTGENKYNFDYAVPKKPEGSYKTKRTLMKIAYVVVPIALIAAFYPLLNFIVFVVFVPLFAILSRPIIGGTWRYVNYDLRYEIKNAGTIRFTRYYGKKFRVDKNDEHADEKVAEKLILEMKIKDFDVVAPYNDPEHRAAFDELKIKNVIDHSSSPSHPNVYYATFRNEAGEPSAILFDMIDRTLSIFEHYNKNTVITELHFSGEDALK